MTTDDVREACRALNIRPDALGYVSEQQLCALLNVKPRTLRNMRERGEGPETIKVGGRLRCHVSAIAAYFTALHGSVRPVPAERPLARARK